MIMVALADINPTTAPLTAVVGKMKRFLLVNIRQVIVIEGVNIGGLHYGIYGVLYFIVFHCCRGFRASCM